MPVLGAADGYAGGDCGDEAAAVTDLRRALRGVATGVVYVLVILAMLLFFAVPEDASAHWVRDIVVTKVTAFVCAGVAYGIGRRL